MINPDDIVKLYLTDRKLSDAILVAHKIVDFIVDRSDLHGRDYIEKYINCLMGEIAEQMVIEWLKNNNKYGKSAVDKTSAKPDMGHDIWLRDSHGIQIRGSIKSSLSFAKSTPKDILNTFTLAISPQEVREVNIQIYFWLSLNSEPRVSVPSMRNAAIMAWASREDLNEVGFSSYKGEQRLAPSKIKLVELRPMKDLLIKLK